MASVSARGRCLMRLLLVCNLQLHRSFQVFHLLPRRLILCPHFLEPFPFRRDHRVNCGLLVLKPIL
jgi:hypothetical protein